MGNLDAEGGGNFSATGGSSTTGTNAPGATYSGNYSSGYQEGGTNRDSSYGSVGANYSSGSGRDGYDSGGYDSRGGSSGYSSGSTSMRNSDYGSLAGSQSTRPTSTSRARPGNENAAAGTANRTTAARNVSYTGQANPTISPKDQSRLPGGGIGGPSQLSTTTGPGGTLVGPPNQRNPFGLVTTPTPRPTPKIQDRIMPAPPAGRRSGTGGSFSPPKGVFGRAVADAMNKGQQGNVASGGKRQGKGTQSFAARAARRGEGKRSDSPFGRIVMKFIAGGEGYRGSRH